MTNSAQLRDDDRLRRITGRQNALVKQLRRSFAEATADEHGEIAIEGMHIVEEAIRSGLRLKTVFFGESARDRAHKLLPQLSAQTEALLLPDNVFANAVPSERPQGIAALVTLARFALDDLFASQPPLLVLTAGLQDPGNLGTIARSAEAFGATGLLLGEGTVSPWNWKAVRASSGSIFRLPVLKFGLESAMNELRLRKIQVLATSSHKGTPVSDVDLSGPVAVIVGNEARGISRSLFAGADEVIGIPHSPRVESLNAGIAASIVLYEAARQRR